MFWRFKKSLYSNVGYCSYTDDEEDGDGDEEVERGAAAYCFNPVLSAESRMFAKMGRSKGLRCNCNRPT